MRAPVVAWIGLGANLGNAANAVCVAARAVAAFPGTEPLRYSSLWRSAPVDASGPDYVNAVLEIRTHMSAPALLQALQAVEQQAGRERPFPHAPRVLDLDLLTYGSGRIASAGLAVPHPRMQQRAFVLRPLAEAAPDIVDPADLARVQDQAVQRLVRPLLVPPPRAGVPSRP